MMRDYILTRVSLPPIELAAFLLRAIDEGDVELVKEVLDRGADPKLIVDLATYATAEDRLNFESCSEIETIAAPRSDDDDCTSSHLCTPPLTAPHTVRCEERRRSSSQCNGAEASDEDGPSQLQRSLFTESLASSHASVQPNKEDNIPLIRACYSGRLGSVAALLDAGADANFTLSATGDITPLRIAVSKGLPKMIEALVLAGARVDDVNAGGRTPLHFACDLKRSSVLDANAFAEVVGALIKCGASKAVKDNSGNRPIDLLEAAAKIDASLIKLLS